MNNVLRWLPLVGAAALVLLMVWSSTLVWNAQGPGPSWSDLKATIAKDEVSEVLLMGDAVRAKLKPKDGGEKAQATYLEVTRVEDATFLPLLEAHNVAVRGAPGSPCTEGVGIFSLITMINVIALTALLLRRDSGPGRGAQAFGRSSARLVPEDGTGVKFDDVAGVDEAAEELREVVQFLKTPEKFTALGGRPPKGVLLVGPPGTGKTLLARAVAGEAGVPFFSISGSDFVEMFVGVGAARVRDLFKNAVQAAPCIIFIDELDAVGKQRGVGGPAGNDEREQTLNQLLVEMDGFDNRKGVIVLSATNRPEILDSALLRPGRFDRQVLVDRPDLEARIKILQVHARRLRLEPDVDLRGIAQMTPGFVGADLANVLNEAALLAARRDANAIGVTDIHNAVERIVAGLEKKNRVMRVKERRIVAYHEVGHAICAAASPGADPVQKISIIPRGMGALGYTITLPTEDRYLLTKAEMLNRVTVLFGGRAAEEIVFGDVTSGASDDIRKATDLARRMITEYGMSKRIGLVHHGNDRPNPFGLPTGYDGGGHAGATAEVIEEELRAITERCYARAVQILNDHRALMEQMSAELLIREVLDGAHMNELLGQVAQAESLEDRPTGEWVAPVG